MRRLIRTSKVVTPLTRGLQQAWSTIVTVTWAAALYRFSVRLISRTHDRAAAATHTLARTHGAYITRVRACTLARTPRETVRRKALTIYFIWLIRFRQRRYIAVCGNSIYASACEHRAGWYRCRPTSLARYTYIETFYRISNLTVVVKSEYSGLLWSIQLQ